VIGVSVLLDATHSTLREVEIEGHSGKAGESLVCAAVSALVRSTARTVEAYGRFDVQGRAATEGELDFSVYETENIRSGDYIWLMGVTDTLLTGIRDIERDYPKECSLEVITGGKAYGT